ncbi:MAG: 30S ribosome-binding factor RbfA [Gammaproteobacteria bacterium]|nr:30S ribosome-binding factor RbfA [Gammaproteobacteria bacterium]
MPKEFPRSRRLEEAIQRILGEALSGKVRDPRLAEVVVTDVQVSRDLSVARVYYTLISGRTETADLSTALRSAAGFFRTALARELRVRRIPELRFLADETLARARSLEQLIEQAVAMESSADSSQDPPVAKDD